jgi:hypothetical protein
MFSQEETVAEYAEIDAEVLVMHDKSMLVTDGDTEDWVPYSLIKDEESDLTENSSKGDTGLLVLPQWKAEELGFV